VGKDYPIPFLVLTFLLSQKKKSIVGSAGSYGTGFKTIPEESAKTHFDLKEFMVCPNTLWEDSTLFFPQYRICSIKKRSQLLGV